MATKRENCTQRILHVPNPLYDRVKRIVFEHNTNNDSNRRVDQANIHDTLVELVDEAVTAREAAKNN